VTNEGRKTATQCAIDAGYEKDSAHVRASELQNPKLFPLVVQYIGKIRSEYLKKYDVTFESHISELAKLRDESRGKGAWSAAINAEVARGKAAGLYVEQKIIRTGKLDDLSEDELDKRIAETLDQYSPILEGITADQLKSEIKSNQEQIRLEGNKKAVEPLPPLKNVTDYSESSLSESSSNESSS